MDVIVLLNLIHPIPQQDEASANYLQLGTTALHCALSCVSCARD